MIEGIFTSNTYQASKALMDVAAVRHKVLAGNLANMETPGFKRLDIDPLFTEELQASIKAGQVGEFGNRTAPVQEERGLAPNRPDGNNISMDRELMLINDNALRYEALGQFVSSSLQRLKTAISGRL
jgi:flagellar basal-body rod protein FlgB